MADTTRVARFTEYKDETEGSIQKKQEGNMPKLEAFLWGRLDFIEDLREASGA